MPADRDMSVEEHRPISEDEAAVVNWLLRYGAPGSRLLHLAPNVRDLHVVSRCSCGCASVDFERDGQASGSHPIADAVGQTNSGSVGLILWGRDDAITGLEVYELDGSAKVLPPIESLIPWPTA